MSWPWQSGQSGQPRPGIGGAHDDADRDQPESGREGERGELLEAVHEAAILPRRHVPTDRDTLSADVPPTPCSRSCLCSPWSSAACGASTPAGSSAGASVRPRHAPEPSDRWGAPGHAAGADRPSSSRTRSPAARRGSCSSTSTAKTASRARRTERSRSRSTTSDRDPDKAVATAEGTFVWTIENERGMYVVERRPARGRARGAPNSRPRRRARRPRPSG